MDRKNSWLLPSAIIIAGAVLGLTLFFVRSSVTAALPAGDISKLRPVSTADHLVGNPAAAVTVVEYSDIDCQYCKQFQEAMEQAMADYGPDGDVAWVFRHFPLVETDPYAARNAAASECAASLGGNDMFFRFIDALHQAAPDTEQFDPAGYGAVASALGLSPSDFQACLDSSKFDKRVADDFANAVAVGATGAPYSVILVRGGDPIPVSGALPYPALKKVLDAALEKAAH